MLEGKSRVLKKIFIISRELHLQKNKFSYFLQKFFLFCIYYFSSTELQTTKTVASRKNLGSYFKRGSVRLVSRSIKEKRMLREVSASRYTNVIAYRYWRVLARDGSQKQKLSRNKLCVNYLNNLRGRMCIRAISYGRAFINQRYHWHVFIVEARKRYQTASLQIIDVSRRVSTGPVP